MRFWAEVEDFFENGIEDLDSGKSTVAKTAAKKERKPVKCPTCFHIHDALPACPSCGHVYSRSVEVLHVEGALAEVKGKSKKPVPTTEHRAAFYAQLQFIAQQKNWKQGAAACQFREKFGEWPSVQEKALPPMEPSQEVLGWMMRSQDSGACSVIGADIIIYNTYRY